MSTKIWIDAADFSNYGKWKLDTQFTHLMGSSYLLACDAPGKPVEDATTKFTVEDTKRYRVWVRARNWYYSYAPGKFEISINGETSGAVLGALMSNDWVWQMAGDFMLQAGEHTLALHDLTGYFARCSSVVITDDMDYIPPRPVAEFEKERAKCLGISLEPTNEGKFDVLVAGAGPGGMPTAVMAARMGSKVVMISDRPVIGGNASDEGGVTFDGASARQYNARSGGIVEEITRLRAFYKCSWGEAMTKLCLAEKNLTIVYNESVCGAKVINGEIKAITTRHTLNGTRHEYTAKMFVDATGDSWLGYHAGADYRIGREAQWQWDEPFAPTHADLLTMSGTVMQVGMVDVGKPVKFEKPDWAVELPKGEKFGRNIEHIGSVWWVEAPNVLDDVYDAEIARDEILRAYVSYFNYLKNSWEEKEKTVNYDFTFINHINKKRESRRLIGDYTLNQNDCLSGRDFDDTVGITGWPIDLHHPKGLYSGEEGPFFSNTHVPLVKIPYRCLYSRNIKNLMMVGRNASVSHVALGTARLQATIGALAQNVGIACHICASENITPRDIYTEHFARYRQLILKWDAQIPNQKNTDDADLARNCKATASSESETERYTARLGYDSDWLPMDRQRASFLAREVSPEIPALWLLLKNESASDIPVKLHVRKQADPDGYTTKEDLICVTETVKANSADWVKFDCNLTLPERYLWCWIEATEHISWGSIKNPPLDFTRSERFSETEKFENIRWQAQAVLMNEPVDLKANCSAQNVLNGYSRIHDENEYAWVSSEGESLPQWLCLESEKEMVINSVHLTFDTDMVNPPMPHVTFGVPKTLARAYIVEAETAKGWVKIAEGKENINRKCVHSFDEITTKKVRVTVTESGDGKTARIFEVRLYNS